MSGSDSEGGVPLVEPKFNTAATVSVSKKRKREAEAEAEAKKKKKAKQRKKKKPKNILDEDLNEQLGVNVAFARMDAQLLADYINQRTAHYWKDMSSVELEDRFIPVRAIQDTSEWEWPRNLEHLAKFLKKSCGKLKPVSTSSKGSPHTLIVAGSGIRAANLARALKDGLPNEGVKAPKVGKLFAKHIKLKEAIEFCSREGMDFGVGTPQRISELLESSALKCSNLKHIVIDASYIDEKKRGILDMKDLHKAVLDLLLRGEFKSSEDSWDDQFRLILY
ncbi:uncharacterized protein BDZ99DRAFT_467003 [Mytilinidion resinicola]|uniref:Protein CMS1 n=1 Tax=Mytilinidion resinicola TaxID=574789 RepID=A0A6A6YA38_9PEZI|nr:uncharacterized protein BDZ99DRAFT_467003 [Mytilinidion resinicola]KAF2805393.1 hypothetical protein BDZ99DRAFT_467003 [Mytilinidion resinicola]